jgi:uncharacterized membrane-anchored protein YhcB (DUF1043 family)
MIPILVIILSLIIGIVLGFFIDRYFKQEDINILEDQVTYLTTQLVKQNSIRRGLENDLSNLGEAYEENIELTRDYRELASRTLVDVYRQLRRSGEDLDIWKRKYYDEIQTNLS